MSEYRNPVNQLENFMLGISVEGFKMRFRGDLGSLEFYLFPYVDPRHPDIKDPARDMVRIATFYPQRMRLYLAKDQSILKSDNKRKISKFCQGLKIDYREVPTENL